MRTSFLLFALIFQFCSLNPEGKDELKKIKLTSYSGWWVYGEGNHIFKDEETLEEWDLFFLNEDVEDVTKLFLDIAEMEYLPIECIMHGRVTEKSAKKFLEVADFEILYVQGCDD